MRKSYGYSHRFPLDAGPTRGHVYVMCFWIYSDTEQSFDVRATVVMPEIAMPSGYLSAVCEYSPCWRGLCTTCVRPSCRVKSQKAKPNPEIEPRKLSALVRSRSKHGWMIDLVSDAQTRSPSTRRVAAGIVP